MSEHPHEEMEPTSDGWVYCNRCGKSWNPKSKLQQPSCNAEAAFDGATDAGIVSREPEVSDDELATALDAALPDTNPKTRMGALKIPLHLVPPSAMHALAIAFEDGARKYGAFNFRDSAVSSSTYYAALLRHVSAWFDGEDVAKDSGIEHLHHAMACLAILIDAKSVGKLNDDRPTAGASAKLQADYLGDVR